MARMSLQDRPILIIDRTFVHQLFNALEAEAAEVLVAVDGEQARKYLERFDFAAVLVGDPPHLTTDLLDAIGDVPVIFYGKRSRIVPTKMAWRATAKNVSAILRALKGLVIAG
jgi:DNA-binding response OmpR family regulator